MEHTLIVLTLLGLATGLMSWCSLTFLFWSKMSKGSWWGCVGWLMSVIGGPALVWALIEDLFL